MKFFLISITLFFSSLIHAVEITNFGSSTFSIDGATSFSTTQTETNLQISGNELNSLLGTYNPVDLSSVWGAPLSISASTVNNTPSTQFTITLFDDEFNTAEFVGGEWSSLLDGSLLTLSNSNGSFDNTNVLGLDLSGSGVGDPINVTLNNLSMVPEPSTYALLIGFLALSYSVIRRHRFKV